MKKSVKTSLKVAGILMTIGMGIFGLGMAFTGCDFSKISNLKQINKTVEVEAFTSLSVEVESGDVKILPAVDGKYKVALKESDLLFHDVRVEDSVLKINERDTRKWYQYVGVSIVELEVCVYLPESAYTAMSVSTQSGDIDVAACSENTQISLRVQSGEITVQNVACQSLTAKAVSGEIELQSLAVSGDLQITTISGDVNFENVSSATASVAVTSGEIHLKDTLATGETSLHAVSGDIRLTACDSGSYTIATSSGNVKGSILTSKIFSARASSGTVRVPATTTGGACNVKTSSGNIILTVG